MLLVVLVIPAVFAPLIAPHSPLDGDLNDRLLPPFWVGETVKYKTVVEKVNRENRLNEILLKDAERRIKIGDGTITGGGQIVQVGDQLEISFRKAGSTKYLLGTDKNGMDIWGPLGSSGLLVGHRRIRNHRLFPRDNSRVLWRDTG